MDIQLTAINFFYGEQQVLHDISLTVPAGTTVALLGPSGAGKSTLLRVFNLLNIPCSGQLALADLTIDCAKPPTEATIRTLRARVGMVFQQYHLWPHLTVIANLTEAPRRVLKLSETLANQRAEGLLTRLDLMPHAHRYPLQLSGGQQQRVAIARALMMQPQLLLFDEPTASLDPAITAQVVAIIQELATTGITQLVVTHDTQVARKVADYIVYMEQGYLIEQGDSHCLSHPKTTKFAHYLSH